jgi:hypothetical protein
MAKVKGTALKNTLEFFQKEMGDEKYAQFIEALPPDVKAVAAVPVLSSGWYEYSLMRKLTKLAEGKVKTPPGRSLDWELGRHSAEAALKGIYKLFFKVADIGFIVKKASYLYPTMYDSGVMELVSAEDKGAVIRIRDFNEPSVGFCDRMQGWMQKTLELTGHPSATILHPKCKARGDAYCEYHGAWD